MIERLILVRHGETVHNVEGIAQGWSDSELSELGYRQIDRLAARIRDMAPTVLYSSTLPRALTTATAIGGAIGQEPIALDDLKEMNCGRWEGQSFLLVRQNEADFFKAWTTDPTVACPEGESFADVRARLERAFRMIEAESSGTAVIVCHGTAIRIAATALLDLPLGAARLFAQDNAAINIFDRRGKGYILKSWNDVNHCD
jgi:broad specificity phosphatase PhoE